MSFDLVIYAPSTARDTSGSQAATQEAAIPGGRSTMALGGFVDWRGRAINREVHGGVTATWFMHGEPLCTDPCPADIFIAMHMCFPIFKLLL
jgi:hypothetical protein